MTTSRSKPDVRPLQLRETAEWARLRQRDHAGERWNLWGPYLSERQWGTVREDYSARGDAWDYFSHDMARSRAYRWGEDGIAGISDETQHLCLSLALWNGVDPILKERLFGLTNAEGNHGEDCKELYYYLDALPSHAYLQLLYKYPQAPYPYAQLVEENRRRGSFDPEFELIDSGVLDDERYFDVFVEYAKADVDDIVMQVTAHNRYREPARLVLAPQLIFRNDWDWKATRQRPAIEILSAGTTRASHPALGDYWLAAEAEQARVLLTHNETNLGRITGAGGPGGPTKDAFHRAIVEGDHSGLLRSDACGTKAAFVHERIVAAGEKWTIRLRLCRGARAAPLATSHAIVQKRRAEANQFYAALQQDIESDDACLVQRQALAGMVWSKQFFYYDVAEWLAGDPAQPSPPDQRRGGRNADWGHLNNADIISMPDKWEYPWYASWDLAFHCVPLALVDATFAKGQLKLLTREWYMHPNGQLPAYEWNFSDVNPPVHAWATWRVFEIDRAQRGDAGDLAFLESVFHKLLLNFNWWVNRKDIEGRNVFQGGFLGLDNIGVFDRSAPLPTGGFINQSDGTSWMAMYSLNLMRIALELALTNRVYEDIATKFFEHFLYIADAMTKVSGCSDGLWDEQDEFYYDVLSLPENGGYRRVPLKIRSMVGLIPLFAVETIEPELLERLPDFAERLNWMLDHRPKLASLVSHWDVPGVGKRRLLSLLRGRRMKRLLQRMLDESEFLSAYGVRSISRHHHDHPYVIEHSGQRFEVRYSPAESTSGLFGGNSNWRGPIWMPVNYLLIESLYKFHHYYGDQFKIECPTGSKRFVSIAQAAGEIGRRLTRIFVKDEAGRRPVYGHAPKMQQDPAFNDHVLFYEYFDGDSGRGVGASHQTGWTGLVAQLIQSQAKTGA